MFITLDNGRDGRGISIIPPQTVVDHTSGSWYVFPSNSTGLEFMLVATLSIIEQGLPFVPNRIPQNTGVMTHFCNAFSSQRMKRRISKFLLWECLKEQLWLAEMKSGFGPIILVSSPVSPRMNLWRRLVATTGPHRRSNSKTWSLRGSGLTALLYPTPKHLGCSHGSFRCSSSSKPIWHSALYIGTSGTWTSFTTQKGCNQSSVQKQIFLKKTIFSFPNQWESTWDGLQRQAGYQHYDLCSCSRTTRPWAWKWAPWYVSKMGPWPYGLPYFTK